MTDAPFFSIIVPTYCRPVQLGACLDALTKLDYPKDRYEIIVINDGSLEVLAPLVHRFSSPPAITFLDRAKAGPAAARNAGVRLARGSYVAFTDDDCEPEADWLNALARRCRERPGALIGGRTMNNLTRSSFSAASHSLILALYAYYNRDPERAHFFTSNNLTLPVDRFWSLGGFDETFPMAAAEDRDLCDRWRDQGWPMVYSSRAVVRHSHRLTLGRFLTQHFRYGRGAWHFQQRRAARAHETRVEPVSFYAGLLTYPWSEPLGWRRLPVAALVFLSQVANAVGYFWEKLQVQQSVPASPGD